MVKYRNLQKAVDKILSVKADDKSGDFPILVHGAVKADLPLTCHLGIQNIGHAGHTADPLAEVFALCDIGGDHGFPGRIVPSMEIDKSEIVKGKPLLTGAQEPPYLLYLHRVDLLLHLHIQLSAVDLLILKGRFQHDGGGFDIGQVFREQIIDQSRSLGRDIRDIGFVLVGDPLYVGAIEINKRKDNAANQQNGAYQVLYGIPITLFRCFHGHLSLLKNTAAGTNGCQSVQMSHSLL